MFTPYNDILSFFATLLFQSVDIGILEKTTSSGEIICRGKLFVGENYLSVKIFVGESFRHLKNFSSLFPEKVYDFGYCSRVSNRRRVLF